MSAKRAFILAALCAAAIAGAAALRQRKAAAPGPAQDAGWARYEGPFIRFRYPKGWKAAHWVSAKTRQGNWAVLTPEYQRDSRHAAGVVNISSYPDQEEKRPLEEMFDPARWPNHRLAGPPGKIAVSNGRCVAYPLEEAGDSGVVSKIHAYCYDGGGRLYDVWAVLGDCLQAGKPTDEARRNARVYEKLLSSLEFL